MNAARQCTCANNHRIICTAVQINTSFNFLSPGPTWVKWRTHTNPKWMNWQSEWKYLETNWLKWSSARRRAWWSTSTSTTTSSASSSCCSESDQEGGSDQRVFGVFVRTHKFHPLDFSFAKSQGWHRVNEKLFLLRILFVGKLPLSRGSRNS